MKTDQERFDNSLAYLRELEAKKKGFDELADQIVSLAKNKNVEQKTLGGCLSLGKRSGKKEDPTWDEDTKNRRALRALLLCQRVYFSNLWVYAFGTPANKTIDCFPSSNEKWDKTFDATVKYWGGKKEADIYEALETFVITSNDPGALAKAAKQPGNTDIKFPVPQIHCTRTMKDFGIGSICYDAVRYWLFRAGLVSYRWMLRPYGSPGPSEVRAIYGDPEKVIWPAKQDFTDQDELPKVPKGFLVHMYIDTPFTWAGHWMVSDGKGGGYGRNNDDNFDKVNRAYGLCNLSKQFLAFKGVDEDYERKNQKKRMKQGIAEIYNPVNIPNRI